MSDAIYVYYKGGRYIYGVPARDLSVAEWQALTPGQKRRAKKLYRKQVVKQKEKKNGD